VFAIEVHGDGDGEARLAELTRQAHNAIGRSLRPGYRPHVSFGVFNADGGSAIREAQGFAAQCKPFDFKIEGVGVFPVTPGVVYAAPVPTAVLLTLHSEFVHAFGALAEALIPYYRAGAWVPHATLLMPASVPE